MKVLPPKLSSKSCFLGALTHSSPPKNTPSPSLILPRHFNIFTSNIFTSMLLAAATVAAIERRFVQAGIWCGAASVLSAAGLMHGYRFTAGDAVLDLSPAWPWAIGYGIMALLFLAAPWVTQPDEQSHR